MTDFFAGCEVTNVRIVEDKLDRKPKGFGYVEFGTVDGLKKALDLSGTSFQGRNIRVSVAEPRMFPETLYMLLVLTISFKPRTAPKHETFPIGPGRDLCLTSLDNVVHRSVVLALVAGEVSMVVMPGQTLVASAGSAGVPHTKEMAGTVTLATGNEGVRSPLTQMVLEKEAEVVVLMGLGNPDRLLLGVRAEQKVTHVDLVANFKRGLRLTESLPLPSLTINGGPRCAQTFRHRPLLLMSAPPHLQLLNPMLQQAALD